MLGSGPVLLTLIARSVALAAASAAASASVAPSPPPAPSPALGQVDFNRDVRPILSQHCFSCHGFDASARKAGLRLDRADAAYATTDGVTPIVPGDPEASEIWRRISATDDDVMPPASAHRPLSDAQKETIRRWIEEGAAYAEHWAFAPPRPASLEPGAEGAASRIDALVGARLRREGLDFAEPADRATLLRRVTLDLTGLPPSAEDVAAFVADADPDAYARAVERLLASPHFGERMALPWLDAARYADTNGFSIDGGRHLWLWRDYVIHAFNENKPYDRFLVEQLAGDLLPDRTDETLVATGFQRNAMITHEGGTIAEENLVTYGADRVRTYGEAVLGLTLGCAQCHDHKFDPISQRDYYRLFAYFNQTTEPAHGGDGGVNAGPVATLRSVLVTGEEDALRARIAELERRLAEPDPADVVAWEADERARLLARGRDLALHPAKVTRMSTPNTGSGFGIVDGRFACVTRPMSFLAFDMALELPTGSGQVDRPITGLRITMHPDPAAPDAGWGYGGAVEGKGRFAVTSVSVSAGTVPGDQVNLYRLVELAGATASSVAEDARGDGRAEGVLETRGDTAWIPDAATEGPVHLTLTFREPLDPKLATHLTAQVNFGRFGDLVAKRMEFHAVTGRDDGTSLPADLVAAILDPTAPRDPAIEARLRATFARHAPATFALRTDLANARERLSARTEAHATMVMDVAPTPRETFILHRGNYADPREKVEAGTPESLQPRAAPPDGTDGSDGSDGTDGTKGTDAASAPKGRLELAAWTVDPANPLVARVAVNRFWQTFFGAGLVRTSGDFGLQGEYPDHPELLDDLACRFRDGGWNVKELVREIVTSRAYRQSSRATPELLARDPDNRLLARGPRFRLPAELIRDAALKTSGLLVAQLGGPSVNPYVPGDPWREISHFGSSPATAQSFIQDHGEKLYRRSLYVYWKRTLPPPSMATFDAPNRETCTLDRASTNTPLQALVLLNDVQFVEAARAFAERILARAGDDASRLAWAFAEATARAPDAREEGILARALARERAIFAADPARAARLLATGESPRDVALDPREHAAWAQVAATILNLSETITRN